MLAFLLVCSNVLANYDSCKSACAERLKIASLGKKTNRQINARALQICAFMTAKLNMVVELAHPARLRALSVAISIFLKKYSEIKFLHSKNDVNLSFSIRS